MDRYIELTKGKVAVVDNADYLRLMKWKWHAAKYKNGKFYAARSVRKDDGKTSLVLMHRQIKGLSHGDIREVDHRDGDGLNNRRGNLRTTRRQKNQWNKAPMKNKSCPYKGIWLSKQNPGSFYAMIQKGKDRFFLGVFSSPESAAIAYDTAAKRLYGAFAWLNQDHFPLVLSALMG